MNSAEVILPIILTSLLILLLISGITISFFIAGRQRSKQQVELAQTRLMYEKELRQVETEVSEQMMQHFAQELHDNIGQLLACIKIEVENKKLDDPAIEKVLIPMEKLTEDASTQLQLLSRSLNTEYISQIGLSNAIQLEVDRQRQLKKFNIEWRHDTSVSYLDKNEELMIFRIFQEIIHNAMKHSRAKNLYISLNNEPHFELMVKDDGKGFNMNELLRTIKASGLNNILKRASLAGMTCNIHTAPNEGCSYRLRKAEA